MPAQAKPTSTPHRAGFVALLGRPNVGKSTLFNALLQKPLAISTPKAQTTRHALLGIDNTPACQVIYVDTPGVLSPRYLLQKAMMQQQRHVAAGADLILWVVDTGTPAPTPQLLKLHKAAQLPLWLVINQVDRLDEGQLAGLLQGWQQQLGSLPMLPVSALHGQGVKALRQAVHARLPVHPPYHPKELLTDRPLRFFVAESIRKALLERYRQELPYSTEVVVGQLNQQGKLLHIPVTLYVERPSQQAILIGKQGKALAALGYSARVGLEAELRSKVFLALRVQVRPSWRSDARSLKQFGYL